MNKMTLDEAIQHCWDVCADMGREECRIEHQQLALWLQELRRRRNIEKEIEETQKQTWRNLSE